MEIWIDSDIMDINECVVLKMSETEDRPYCIFRGTRSECEKVIVSEQSA